METSIHRHIFDAVGPDFGFEVESADGFAEERCFFSLGFGQGDLERGEEELDGEAGEAGAGAEVEESSSGRKKRLDVDASEQAFAEVAADDFFRFADGGEVGAGVPAQEDVEVEAEVRVEGRRYGCAGEVGFEERGDLGFAEGHGATGRLLPG